MTLGVILGLVGSLLSIIAYLMKSMLPLRAVALGSNVCFLTYGIIEAQLPSILLNLVAIPLNFVRWREIRKLVRDIESVKADSPLAEWLLPHMSLRRFPADHVLFHKGDLADEMFYIRTGSIRLPEIDVTLQPDALLGEIGTFSPDSRRTQSAVCAEDCELYSMTRADVVRLYYQNPKLGFQLMLLIINRLGNDARRNTESGPSPASGNHVG